MDQEDEYQRIYVRTESRRAEVEEKYGVIRSVAYRWSCWSLFHGIGLIAVIASDADCEYVSSDVRSYLTLFLCCNAIFETAKLILLGCLVKRCTRNPEQAENLQLKILVAQTVTNFAIFVRGHRYYPDEVADWFW